MKKVINALGLAADLAPYVTLIALGIGAIIIGRPGTLWL